MNSTTSSEEAPRRSRPFLRWTLRGLLALLVLAVLVLVIGGLWFRQHVEKSLPRLDGEVAVEGLAFDVTIERDAQGVPTIRGQTRFDVARGLGFLHGQERFFQMDTIRRKAAGELSELVGGVAIRLDRRMRLHRFRARAEAIVEGLDDADRRLLEAYTEGVNAGREDLGAPPWEYAVLRTDPVPWRPADCILTVLTMYIDLQGNGGPRERAYGVAHDILPPALYEFLTPHGTEWDAPIDGEAFEAPPIPTREEMKMPAGMRQVARLETGDDDELAALLDLVGPGALAAAGLGLEESPDLFDNDLAVGSNNWAVAGTHTTHGEAMVADDMHLGHDVPNIWYRASFVYPDPDRPGEERRVTGVTLPGVMIIAAGSSSDVSWGFTNSYGDYTDLVVVEPDPNDPESSYLTPDGPRRFERHQEILRTKGGDEEVLEVVNTIWGPVWFTDHQGRQLAKRWVAHDPRAVNLESLGLETARSLEEAMRVANTSGIPAQNFVIADNQGRIGWTIMGPIPRRFGHDGRLPTSWANGERGWNGYLWPEEYPRVVDPESGRIWTANARVVSGDMLALLGDGGYDLGARAGQIRDGLMAIDSASEADLLAVQLDDRALFLERWRDLLLEVLTPEVTAAAPLHAALRDEVEKWNGRASVDSTAYRLVRAFRLELSDVLLTRLTEACREADPFFRPGWLDQDEGPLWQLVSEQPVHLLDPQYATWQEQFVAAVNGMLEEMLAQGGKVSDLTWGERNTSAIRHPLSSSIPFSSRWLDMPAEPLPGDSNMPRVQGPSFGASERFVVSPTRQDEGYFHMPSGQAAHPMSPYFRAGHEAWMRGEPTPFLPGETAYTLRLTAPESRGPVEPDGAARPLAETPSALPEVGATGPTGQVIEGVSLLGQPLQAPDLDPEFRAEQERLLAAAEAELAERPDDPDALIWVGRRTAYLGGYRDAIEIYSRGIEQNPQHAALYRHRGHRLISTRQIQSAISDLERAAGLIRGTLDKIEPDGLPNARNVPTSTHHGNIWYHLGLAYYVRGDLEKAAAAYARGMSFAKNPDMRSATAHWSYMSLRRQGRDREAEALLAEFEPGMDIIENHDYYRLVLMYKGLEDPAALLAEAEEAGGVTYATVGYGVGNWYYLNGDQARAFRIFQQVAENGPWAAFGTLAAEAEVARSAGIVF